MKNWKVVKKTKVFTCNWLTVEQQELVRPNKSKATYFVVNKDPVVIVVAQKSNELLLVNEFRAAVGKRVWSFPAGYAETKNLLSDAKRELKEETGISASSWNYLGKLHHNPGLLNDFAKVYLAEDLVFGKHEREISEEDMVTKWVSVESVKRMIKKGEVFGGGFLASFYFYLQYKKLL